MEEWGADGLTPSFLAKFFKPKSALTHISRLLSVFPYSGAPYFVISETENRKNNGSPYKISYSPL